MKRNWIAVLTACALSMSVLAGCGPKEPEAQIGAKLYIITVRGNPFTENPENTCQKNAG